MPIESLYIARVTDGLVLVCMQPLIFLVAAVRALMCVGVLVHVWCVIACMTWLVGCTYDVGGVHGAYVVQSHR